MGTTSVTRLLLVRHGESRAGNDGIIAGPRGCTGLSDTGRLQASHLGDRLAKAGPEADVLLTSPLRRAVETAEVLGERLGIQTRVEAGLEELRPGESDGLTSAEAEARYGHFDMLREPLRTLAPGGESWSRFHERVGSTTRRLLEDFSGQTVLAVCHSGFIVVTMIALLDIPRPGNQTYLAPALTSLTEWSHDGQHWALERYNDHAHLTGP